MTDVTHFSVREFVLTLYGAEPGAYLSLWCKKTKRTQFFLLPRDIGKVVRAVEVGAQSDDVYFGLALLSATAAPRKRGGVENAASIPGCFADIDFRLAKDGRKRYPKDQAEALQILDSLPYKPTLVIHTGNGLHVHWLFSEPWKFRTVEDRSAAISFSRDFQRALQAHFKQHGCEIDSVGDIVRNFRIPRTLNHKSSPPKDVRVIHYDPISRVDRDVVAHWLAGRPKVEPIRSEASRKNYGETAYDHALIQRGCEWYRTHTGEGAALSGEPDWYATLSIAARVADGERIAHDYSEKHPKYDKREASEKFRRAATEAGPRTCESIEEDLAFSGCQKCPNRGLITSPLQLGRPPRRYLPGAVGPVPLGYTRAALYAFRDQTMRVILQLSAQQLLSQQCLLGLAPSAFWRRQFLSKKGQLDSIAAGEALMAACRAAGPFNPAHVRGRGIWLEGDRIVVNLGGEVPKEAKHLYLCFEPIPLEAKGKVDAARLLALLQLFNWRNRGDAMLLLGWLAIAPICGALAWRPHCFVYGPARCGKTTIHSLAAQILHPLVISTDGSSSEAGIRQTLGPDSLPIIIDEFESDQNTQRQRQIIRLARSASSADNPVLRGTPEGKALQFSLRTTFFFSAVNPGGMSVADESRILQFELLMQENDREVAAKIRTEEAHFRPLGPQWCAWMVAHAGMVCETLEVFLAVLPAADRRHRQNMATLLAGAYVALHEHVPSQEEAEAWLSQFAVTIELHAEALDRDDAAECLAHLFAHVVEDFPLGHWVAVAHNESHEHEGDLEKARKIVRQFDMLLYHDNEQPGLLVRNGSPAIERIFDRSQWERRVWMKSLKKLQGAFTPRNPVHFPNVGKKDRCTGLPFSCIPEPFESPADESKGRY